MLYVNQMHSNSSRLRAAQHVGFVMSDLDIFLYFGIFYSGFQYVRFKLCSFHFLCVSRNQACHLSKYSCHVMLGRAAN